MNSNELLSSNMQAVCLAACKKLHEMGAFTDMLLPDKGSGGDGEKADENDEGDPLPGTARHREFYPEGVAKTLQVSLIDLTISFVLLHSLNKCERKFFYFYFFCIII